MAAITKYINWLVQQYVSNTLELIVFLGYNQPASKGKYCSKILLRLVTPNNVEKHVR